MSVATTDLANAFLDRAFREHRVVTARALGGICCLASFAYAHLNGRRLLAEEVMVTGDGPRLYSLGDKFRGYGDDPVTAYLRTASPEVRMVGDDDADLAYVIRRCWNSTRTMSVDDLDAILTCEGRCGHGPGTPDTSSSTMTRPSTIVTTTCRWAGTCRLANNEDWRIRGVKNRGTACLRADF